MAELKFEVTETELRFILNILQVVQQKNHWHGSAYGSRLIKKIKKLLEASQ